MQRRTLVAVARECTGATALKCIRVEEIWAHGRKVMTESQFRMWRICKTARDAWWVYERENRVWCSEMCEWFGLLSYIGHEIHKIVRDDCQSRKSGITKLGRPYFMVLQFCRLNGTASDASRLYDAVPYTTEIEVCCVNGLSTSCASKWWRITIICWRSDSL